MEKITNFCKDLKSFLNLKISKNHPTNFYKLLTLIFLITLTNQGFKNL